MLKWVKNLTYKIENHAANAGLLYRIAQRYYANVIEKEAVLANMTSADHVLCIGGGMCPFTAILFHQVTGAKVTVIDNNLLCIPKAQQVIERLGIGESVKVLYKDGGCSELDYSQYSVIHLALQVSPMEQVFFQVEQRALPGTRLLMRRPKKHLDKMYCSLFHNELPHRPYTTHKSRNIGSTLLYTKQIEAAGALA